MTEPVNQGRKPPTIPRNAILSAAQLQQFDLPPPKAIVPGLLYVGHALLVGPPKLGKSWLALQIAIEVSRGGELLGHKVRQSTVLYLALEDTFPRLKSRLGLLLGDDPWPEKLHVTTDWPRLDEGGEQQLISYLGQWPDCRLVFVDTLEKARARGGREFSYSRDYEAGAAFKRIADEREMNITSVHHLRKMPSDDPLEQISGSSGLLGAVDGVLLFRRERGRGTLANLLVTGRDVEDENELRLAGGPGSGWWLDDTSPRADTEERGEVLRLMASYGFPCSARELHARYPNAMALGTLRKRMERMAQDGELTVMPSSGGDPRAGKVYCVTPAAGVGAATAWR